MATQLRQRQLHHGTAPYSIVRGALRRSGETGRALLLDELSDLLRPPRFSLHAELRSNDPRRPGVGIGAEVVEAILPYRRSVDGITRREEYSAGRAAGQLVQERLLSASRGLPDVARGFFHRADRRTISHEAEKFQ
uniref:Uncharacterized protein n=1 Tax=Trichogramma kaykai TaxID=54128 RepID=A0ABD2XQ64_9HYME